MQREWTMNWWEIENVHQRRIGEDWIEIYFTVDKHAYFLEVRNTAGKFVPWNIIHTTNEKCLFCHENDRKGKPCEEIYDFRDSLFYRLIDFHSIRLEWVFLEYKEKETRKGLSYKHRKHTGHSKRGGK